MAENKVNRNTEEAKDILAEQESFIDTDVTTDDTAENDDALSSFLNSESPVESEPEKPRKMKPSTLAILIGSIVVLLIAGLVILLQLLPSDTEEHTYDEGTALTTTIDENGTHQAQVTLNSKGELDNNSYGVLLEYVPSDISEIDVSNESGNFTVLAQTPVEVNEDTNEETTSSTIYTIKGYEDISLQSGGPDTIANDVAAISFTSVADPTGDNASDFGFDNPRAVVKTKFTDGTSSLVTVGDDAPQEKGTYIMFGDSKTVYVIASESADGFLYSILDLVTLSVNDAAADTDSSQFESVTLSGSAFSDAIEIRPNEDSAIDSSYVMITPEKMFVSEVEAANISGGIRGLYAQEVMCVNPSSSQLEKYGLSTPYASITAIYPDTTIHIKASQPKDGYVYIIADSDIVYKMEETAVPWVNSTMEKLIPDVVIDPNFASLEKIVVKDTSGTYSFDVTTITESVEAADGVTEETEVTTAVYKGKELDSDNFRVFYQNICNMQNAGATDSSPSGEPVLTITLYYSTGREADVISVYPTGNTKYIAALNGKVQCLVYKSYCTKFSQCVQDLINGDTVSSF